MPLSSKLRSSKDTDKRDKRTAEPIQDSARRLNVGFYCPMPLFDANKTGHKLVIHQNEEIHTHSNLAARSEQASERTNLQVATTTGHGRYCSAGANSGSNLDSCVCVCYGDRESSPFGMSPLAGQPVAPPDLRQAPSPPGRDIN